MPTRLIRCEHCNDVLGELTADGVFISRHHRRKFVDAVIVECRCGGLWLNPDVPIDDDRAKRLARVLAPPVVGAA